MSTNTVNKIGELAEYFAQTNAPLPRLWTLRHGETEWSKSGRHTGLTDLPLTDHGRDQARNAAKFLAGTKFDAVFSSPSQRAQETAALAGFPDFEVLEAAHEWDYGQYEGVSSTEIRKDKPDFLIWNDGVPGGETLEQVGARADQVIARILEQWKSAVESGAGSAAQNFLLVAHGHFLRILAARWCMLEPQMGRHLILGTAAVNLLGWERYESAIEKWNLT